MSSVEKKINKPDHKESSNSKNDNDNDDCIEIPNNNKQIVEPSEIHEIHDTQSQKMDVDDDVIKSPGPNEVSVEVQTMEEN